MRLKSTAAAAACAALAAVILHLSSAHAQERRSGPTLDPADVTELRAQDDRMNRMLRGGGLRLRRSRPDGLVPGRP